MDNIKVIVSRSDMVAIADAVRNKHGTTDEMTLGEIVAGITNIEGGGTSTGFEYINSAVETISNYAFMSCTSITVADCSDCTTIGSYAFNNCTSLTSVNFPACTTIGSYAFNNCTSLTSVNFPACTTISGSAFRQCTQLTTISLPACTTIGSYAFYSCTLLSSLYLTGSTVCVLQNSNALSGTKMYSLFASKAKGRIYVPASLLASYKSATQWSRYSAIMLAYDA